MPKKQRRKSSTGIYHVMVRGINRQDIFQDENDYLRMMNAIRKAPLRLGPDGKVLSSDRCHIYAYCLLANHAHILLKEGTDDLKTIMHRINTSYATYYNLRYERVGHLFQGNFDSEPVEDNAYFKQAFRYIHRNPVKATDLKRPEQYAYCSWNEYVPHKSNLMHVLQPDDMTRIYDFMSRDSLLRWVDADNADRCLDMDDFFSIRTDKEAWDVLTDLTTYTNPEDFRLLDQQTQIYYLMEAIERGVTVSQASRLGTLSRFQINRAINRKVQGHEDLLARKNSTKRKTFQYQLVGDFSSKLTTGSNPVARKLEILQAGTSLEMVDTDMYHERVRMIRSLNARVYHQLHQIVDFLALNPESKCAAVADHLGICSESARKHLFRMSNENIVVISGQARARTYSLA